MKKLSADSNQSSIFITPGTSATLIWGKIKLMTNVVCGLCLLCVLVFVVCDCVCGSVFKNIFCLFLTPYLLHKSHLQWNLPICGLLDYLGFVHLFHCNLPHMGTLKICCDNYTGFANGTGVQLYRSPDATLKFPLRLPSKIFFFKHLKLVSPSDGGIDHTKASFAELSAQFVELAVGYNVC